MRLQAMWIYPVKSCRGVAVSSAHLVARGLEHDRRFMVVDEHGVFLSQRTLPAMATVATAMDAGELFLSRAGIADARVPLSSVDGPRRNVRVWSDELEAVVHEGGSRFFRAALGIECSLVHLPDDVERFVTPKHGRPGEQVSFADAYPLLLLSQASLDELSRRVGSPVEMTRFRPNLVIDGDAPHAEDRIGRLRIGDRVFRSVKRCDRCSIPAVDPFTGERGVEPTRTLATYRREEGKVWFGMNLVHEDDGPLCVGADVEELD
ncbi:MAG: MOSC domain-containing protein [Polyangiaceae bacterium]|nr:MOSC domain-containing protein [Polyangiaceae bacterium]